MLYGAGGTIRRPTRPQSGTIAKGTFSWGDNFCLPSAHFFDERIKGPPRSRSDTAGAMLKKSPCRARASGGMQPQGLFANLLSLRMTACARWVGSPFACRA